MKLIINGKEEILDKQALNVSELLQLKEVKMPDMVSVQINEDFIERNDFTTYQIKEGDVIDFLYFMGGGWNIQEVHQ